MSEGLFSPPGYRIGIDVTTVAEVTEALATHGEAYLHRIFGDRERADAGTDPQRLAARFAAKEALVKALGERGVPTPPRDVEVILTDDIPRLSVGGLIGERMRDAGLAVVSVSLTHTDCHAAAVVLLGPT